MEVLDGTTRVTCHGSDLAGPFGSRLARGTPLPSPDGRFVAQAEVEAKALAIEDAGEGTCRNVSRLYVTENGRRQLVFTQQPGWEGRNGNALDLVAWSPDGSRLLVELHTWTYPTDPPDPLVFVWDAATRQTAQIASGADLSAQTGGACRVTVHAAGFAADGAPLLRTVPAAGQECAGGERHWVYRAGEPPHFEPASAPR